MSEEPRASAMTIPDAEEVGGWVGHKLDAIDGEGAGRVEGYLVDAEDGSPSWLVVKASRFGRRTAVPIESAAAGIGHVWVPFDRSRIKGAPEVPGSDGLDRQLEGRLAEHFGLTEASARVRRLRPGDDDERTSVPPS